MGNKTTLQLSLKNEWFEMTKAGVKTEDYREVTGYWCKRLLATDINDMEDFWGELLFCYGVKVIKRLLDDPINADILIFSRKFTTNTMTLGYPKKGDKERTLKLEHKGIEIRTGNPEWGAEDGILYFVIKHGKIKDND